MNRERQLLREIEALRRRLSGLSEASVRINQSLEFDTVLQEVVDSARVLIGARYGVMAVVGESGELQNFVTSGFDEQERQLFMNLPEGRALFEHFNRLSEPLRIRDFQSLVGSLGFPDLRLPMRVSDPLSCLAAPILYRGQCIGNVYLAEKERATEFTPEDENILVMFASQSALVIANASRHRDEQRARADLETLIDTSPVGVAVFNARTGAPVSFNREAVRIMDELRTPGQPPEQLLEIMTVRRADGREISLEDLPMAQVLSAGETVRAEEVVFQVPNGRRVTALLNATPIQSEGGEIETFMVTIQDLTSLEELERLRAEFLAMVSHELRTPLATVRGSVSTLLDDHSGLHPAEVRQFHRIIFEQTDRMRALIADLLDVARIETGALTVAPEPTSLAVLTAEAGNAFHIGGYEQVLHIDIPPDLPWIMADRPRIIQVLGNLLSNAARHSPESSAIRVSAVRDGLHAAITVSDDGTGIAADSLPRLFRKFSRIEGDDKGGDTGLGLAVCRGIVEAHGGRIWAESDGPNLGARFTFTLPTVEENELAPPPPFPERTSRAALREKVRILAVDDDPQALRYVRDALDRSGFTVITTGNPDEVARLLAKEKPHLVLLDLVLPGADGVALMKDISETGDVPVIFVSAYGQDHLIATAFEMGAEDYVVKPFSPTELVARIRAALRRRETPEPRTPYVHGELVMDYAERLLTVGSVPVSLTVNEYRLLVELSSNAGRVVTYERLLSRVWNAEGDGDVRPIRTAISALRRKLGDNADNPVYIFNELGVGYRMPKADTWETSPGQIP